MTVPSLVIRGVQTPLKSLPLALLEEGRPLALIEPQRRYSATRAPVSKRAATATKIPRATTYSVKRRSRGLVVYSLQACLNGLGYELDTDGVFGKQTEGAVEIYQEGAGLDDVDGIAGPDTSRSIAEHLEDGISVPLPGKLLWGQVLGESGALIGAVSWLSPGGVDCSLTQRRVYEGDFGNRKVERKAFHGPRQLRLSAETLRSRHDAFYGRTGARSHELAWRLAAQYHNYPAGATKVADVGIGGLSSYYTSPQGWVLAIGARFDDGAAVRTPLEWMQAYALGSPAHQHPGWITRYVTSWAVT